MATRRSRIVIKPNIKASGIKSSSAQSKETPSKGSSGSENAPVIKATSSEGSDNPSKTIPEKNSEKLSTAAANVSGGTIENDSLSISVTDTSLVKNEDEPIKSCIEEKEGNNKGTASTDIINPASSFAKSKSDNQQSLTTPADA